jgi:dihydropteroate synthase
MQLTETEGTLPLSRLDHALYLGRELQRAEHCLLSGLDYIQD